METNLMQVVFLIIACGLAFQAYRNNQNSKNAERCRLSRATGRDKDHEIWMFANVADGQTDRRYGF